MYPMAFSPYAGGPITMDHENTVKAYAASPNMLGSGRSLVEHKVLFGCVRSPRKSIAHLEF